MLWTVLLIVLVMWALGFGFGVGGSLIHILLVVRCGLGPQSSSGPQSRLARMNRFGPNQFARALSIRLGWFAAHEPEATHAVAWVPARDEDVPSPTLGLVSPAGTPL